MIFDLGRITASDVIAALSLVVAILSLSINLIPVLRDRARIDFSLYLAEAGSFQDNRFVKTGDFYAFRVVNSGRRPVTVTHVGGVSYKVGFFNYWFWRFTGLGSPRMFFINDPGLMELLKRPDGSDKTLAEGESSFGSVKIDRDAVRRLGGLRARQFHVLDSLGRYHRLPWLAKRKLDKSIKTLLD